MNAIDDYAAALAGSLPPERLVRFFSDFAELCLKHGVRQQFLPFSDARKDGLPILAFDSGGKPVAYVRWDGEGWSDGERSFGSTPELFAGFLSLPKVGASRV
jgi:hypothetical protein